MLIELEIKRKLPVIDFFILHDVGLEKFVDVILDKQGMFKDAHDLDDWATNLMIMFNDTDETVCNDGNMYLNTNGILAIAPKGLDLEMLFDPLKEQLDLPSIFIKERDFTCFKIEVIGIIGKRSLQIWSVVDDTSDRNRIVAFIPFASKSDSLVSKDIILSLTQVFTLLNGIIRMELLSDNEEGTSLLNGKKSCKIEIAAIKDIACKPFVINAIHKVDIMNLGCGNSVEDRNFRGNINLRMDFDTTLSTSKLSPSENREAEVNGSGVNGIESSMKFKLLGDSSLLSLAEHIEGKLFIDPVITESIGLGNDASIRSGCSEAEIVRTFGMSLDNVNKFPETGTARKLCIYKHTKMIPMSETPVLCPVVVPTDNAIELALEPVGYLVEDIVPRMHNYSNLNLGTKVRISNVGHYFQNILFCA